MLFLCVAYIVLVNTAAFENEYLPFLQIDDVDSGQYDNPRDLPQNSCTRPCGKESRICYYRFTFEAFSANGAACRNCTTNINDCYKKGCITTDGYERAVLSINRRMPGPSIQVCQGDLIIVDVMNAMPGRSTTVHWHGMKMKNSKFMDGIPMVTQCPIHEADTFRYSFPTDDDPGLHFYHSHDGYQKMDGIVGALMIRVARTEDPNYQLYDQDLPSHVFVVQDWHHLTADSMVPGLRYNDTDQEPQTYLIQGRGRWYTRDGEQLTNTPLSVFNVTQGIRYVFRIIAGTCFECQYIFTIENHDMTIIGADALPTQPYLVNSLTMSPGERYSVVIDCNKPVRSYWMQVRTVGYCNATGAYQLAVLKYRGADDTPPTPAPTYSVSETNNPGLTMSPVNSICTEETRFTDGPCVPDLRSTSLTPQWVRQPKPDLRIFWAVGFYVFTEDELFDTSDYKVFLQSPPPPYLLVGSTINGIVYKPPPSPLLSQYEDIPRKEFCPARGFDFRTWNVVHRECVHVMKVPANKVVEIVIVDTLGYGPAGMSHSMHLHGYEFYVLDMGLLQQGVSFNESFSQFKRYLHSSDQPPIPIDVVNKDTVPLTSGGYIVTRILTDNPGFWFFHCHFNYHLETGMAGVLQVGNVATFPPPPKNFPRCGDFLTTLK